MPELNSIILIGGGSDAPSIRLVPDGQGGWKIERVPGWNPEELVELGSVLELVAGAARLKDEGIAHSIVSIAAKVASAELERGGVEGATVVVVAR